MTKKNLIIFMPSIEGGGVEKNLFIVANYLSKKINNISLITTSYKYKKKFNRNINIILPKEKYWDRFSRRLKYLICLFMLFKKLIKNKNHIVFAFQANLYCVLICKLLSIKIIIRSNSAPEGWSKNIIKKILYKNIISLADKVMVNSYDFQKSMRKNFDINPVVIYNPLNRSEIIKKSKLKIKNIFPKNCLKIINIGRFVGQKDQITILKSLNIIKEKINFYAIFLGRGILKNKLINYTNNNDLNNNIKFIDFQKNPYPFIKHSDILILSSKYEGLPNVLLEAITLKKFVISTNCPTGPREILSNGKGGYLFPIGDVKNLSNKIVLYNKNKNKNKKYIKFAYKKLERFDYNANLNKYLNLVNSLR